MGTVNSTMSLVVLLTCIATLQSAGAANMKDCCLKKTVGGESYSLVKKDKEFTSMYGCPAPCIYEKVGSPGSKFCFKPGDLEVECQEMVEGTTFPYKPSINFATLKESLEQESVVLIDV